MTRWDVPPDWADRVISTTGELAIFLGGSETSFTGQLLALFAKADPGNWQRLANAFPEEALALIAWTEADPAPTWAQLAQLLRRDGWPKCSPG